VRSGRAFGAEEVPTDGASAGVRRRDVAAGGEAGAPRGEPAGGVRGEDVEEAAVRVVGPDHELGGSWRRPGGRGARRGGHLLYSFLFSHHSYYPYSSSLSFTYPLSLIIITLPYLILLQFSPFFFLSYIFFLILPSISPTFSYFFFIAILLFLTLFSILITQSLLTLTFLSPFTLFSSHLPFFFVLLSVASFGFSCRLSLILYSLSNSHFSSSPIRLLFSFSFLLLNLSEFLRSIYAPSQCRPYCCCLYSLFF
jgi:hypothetical protein